MFGRFFIFTSAVFLYSSLVEAQPANAVFEGDSLNVIRATSTATSGAGRTAVRGVAITVDGSVGVVGIGATNGVNGIATKSGTGTRRGIYGRGDSATTTFGGYFDAYRGTSQNYAVAGLSWSAGGTSYGLYGSSSGASGTGYAVYGTGGNYAGYFNGNVLVTGTFSNPSDLMFKKNVRSLDGGLNKIMALKPKAYEMNVGKFKNVNLASGEKYGLVAQDVEAALPELVTTGIAPTTLTEDGKQAGKPVHFKSVDYLGLIPILVKAVQEQQATIQSLQNEISSLRGH